MDHWWVFLGHMSKPWKMVEIAPFVPQLGPIPELMGGVMHGDAAMTVVENGSH